MFLTRIGFGSKCVVTGDVTQIDVPGGRSGLIGLEPVLGGIDDISFVHLSRRDVVRHKIVADIVDAYEVAKGRAGSTQGRSTSLPPMSSKIIRSTLRSGRTWLARSSWRAA